MTEREKAFEAIDEVTAAYIMTMDERFVDMREDLMSRYDITQKDWQDYVEKHRRGTVH